MSAVEVKSNEDTKKTDKKSVVVVVEDKSNEVAKKPESFEENERLNNQRGIEDLQNFSYALCSDYKRTLKFEVGNIIPDKVLHKIWNEFIYDKETVLQIVYDSVVTFIEQKKQ